MFHRLTQTEQFWTQEFTVDADDIDLINNLLLEEERPLPIGALTLAVMSRRVDHEETKLKRLLSKGSLYKPEDSFSEGETLVFPALGFAAATVAGVRPGYNPEFGEFQVIQVDFSRTGRRREFAASLKKPHALNAETDRLAQEDSSLRTVEELHRLYGQVVEQKLLSRLQDMPDLIHLFGLWFLKALVIEVGPGHLNIAEAILDIAGGVPLNPSALLKDLGLPAEARPELLEFSLNYALDKDERFDEVGPAGQVLWYLRRMEPPDVLHPPRRLTYTPVHYDPNLLNLNLRRLEQELDDEWSRGWQSAGEPDHVSFTLTYPHRRHGTIPLSSRIAPLFPTSYQTPRIRCTFMDGETGKEIEAWVVWEGRFVHGLGTWYEENRLPIGAYVQLSPGPEPGVVIIQYTGRRSQREWVRVATAEEGNLIFGMQKRSVSCDYDDMMMIGMHDLEKADEVWIKAEEHNWSLAHIMVKLFPELAKLSPQNTVHAKTLYSAVNMARRCPPGPIFAELVRQPCFISMGENYWRFNPSLWSGG